MAILFPQVSDFWAGRVVYTPNGHIGHIKRFTLATSYKWQVIVLCEDGEEYSFDLDEIEFPTEKD